jgi:hypothetical protein
MTHPLAHRVARCRALDFEHREPGLVDRLERQGRLDPADGRRVAFGRRRAVTVELGAVTLKAERAQTTRFGWVSRVSRAAGGATRLLAAGQAQLFRAFAFQLAAREANPLISNDLVLCVSHTSLQATGHGRRL